MRERHLQDLLTNAADAAFITHSDGAIRFWNQAAEKLFGIPAGEAAGQSCAQLLEGLDAQEARFCRLDCPVLEMAEQNDPVRAFDLNVKTSTGLRRWINVSVLHMRASGGELLVVHLVRDIDRKKKLEAVTERFLVQVGSLTGQDVDQLLTGAPAPHFALTSREREIIQLLARSLPLRAVSQELKISYTTARNHLQHIMRKLSAHSRTEAILRAMKERLL